LGSRRRSHRRSSCSQGIFSCVTKNGQKTVVVGTSLAGDTVTFGTGAFGIQLIVVLWDLVHVVRVERFTVPLDQSIDVIDRNGISLWLEIVTHVFIRSCKGSQGGSGGYYGSSSGMKDGDFHLLLLLLLLLFLLLLVL
jgi:hypothetical protein